MVMRLLYLRSSYGIRDRLAVAVGLGWSAVALTVIQDTDSILSAVESTVRALCEYSIGCLSSHLEPFAAYPTSRISFETKALQISMQIR
jgi:hypothetical protein